MKSFDTVIIGAGIIGLAVARALKASRPDLSVIILDKEPDVAAHASGRNSGVLHAGFYYTADSFKARFTVEGNRLWKEYCRQRDLPVNACGKLVVAKDATELDQLSELLQRGERNGSSVRLISREEAEEIEPNVETFRKALFSPDTASIDPVRVCQALREDLQKEGVDFRFNTPVTELRRREVITPRETISCRHIVNCAGLYADKLAQHIGFGSAYTVIPFKGLYLKYTKNTTDIGINIYPVPNLKNPFLGVHFTKTVDGTIKIGPTATPAFWREQYTGWDGFSFKEMMETGWHEARLFISNAFGFRSLAFEEMRKYHKPDFIALAGRMVKSIDPEGFTEYTTPGIRAQLLHPKTKRLVQDFVIEGDESSTHILNAVSPAFTCALPFGQYVVRHHVLPGFK